MDFARRKKYIRCAATTCVIITTNKGSKQLLSLDDGFCEKRSTAEMTYATQIGGFGQQASPHVCAPLPGNVALVTDAVK